MAGDDAKKVQWFPADKLPSLAFDHGDIIHIALERLKELIQLKAFGQKLLPKHFSLSDLERLFNYILTDREIIDKYINKYIKYGVISRIEPESELYFFSKEIDTRTLK